MVNSIILHTNEYVKETEGKWNPLQHADIMVDLFVFVFVLFSLEKKTDTSFLSIAQAKTC